VTCAIPCGSRSAGTCTQGDASEPAPTGSSVEKSSDPGNVLMEAESSNVLMDSSAHAAEDTNAHSSPVQGPRTMLQNNIKKPKDFSNYVCYLAWTRELESLGEAMENAK
jgi:hypothetical protein